MTATITTETKTDSTYASGAVDRIVAPYGAKVPLSFKSISYQGYTPTSHAAITWKLIIKSTRDASDTVDTAAIIDVTNASLTLGTAPFAVGYALDTTATGFAERALYYGELWADDSTYGLNPVAEFQLRLGPAVRAVFT